MEQWKGMESPGRGSSSRNYKAVTECSSAYTKRMLDVVLRTKMETQQFTSIVLMQAHIVSKVHKWGTRTIIHDSHHRATEFNATTIITYDYFFQRHLSVGGICFAII